MAISEAQLNRRKKASAGLSVATSTIGIGALGLAGARAGAPRALKAAHKVGRLKSVKPKQVKRFRAKSSRMNTGLLTAGAGIGGINGFNYASIQNAEAKRRRVSKAMTPEQRKNRRIEREYGDRGAKRGFTAGFAGGAALTAAAINPRATGALLKAPVYGARASGKLFRQSKPTGNPAARIRSGKRTPLKDKATGLRGDARQTASRVRSAAIGGREMARFTAGQRKGSSPLTPLAATTGGLYGGVIAGQAGEKRGKLKARKDPRYVRKNMDVDDGLGVWSPVHKAKENKQAQAAGIAGFAGAGGAFAGAGVQRRRAGAARRRGAAHAAESFSHAMRFDTDAAEQARSANLAENHKRIKLTRSVGHFKRAGAVGLAVGGTGAVVHNRSKQVKKAYDPEKKRMRRLDRYADGSNIAAGALGAGAGFAGAKTAGKLREISGKKTVSVPKLKSAGKAGGATAALGLAAVGAAVGADRIKRYKRGNGRSYRPITGQY